MYFEKIPILQSASYIIRDFNVPFIDYPLHFHPEYELNLVVNSTGHRTIGDSLEKFEIGDLVLVGPGLPHQWTNDEPFMATKLNSYSIVLQLRPDFIPEDLLKRDEFNTIGQLLEQSRRGIWFPPDVAAKAGVIMHKLLDTGGIKGYIRLLELFLMLTTSHIKRLLASQGFVISAESQSDKINPIFNFIHEHYASDLSVGQLAERFNMSSSAFSHFFRKKTGKTVVAYLNELRIGQACKLLVQSDDHISDIAFRCGFESNSYFNRRFRQIKRMTPGRFRQLFITPDRQG